MTLRSSGSAVVLLRVAAGVLLFGSEPRALLAEVALCEWATAQRRAPEALLVEVLAVRTQSKQSTSGRFTQIDTEVDGTARIQKVERSGSGLRPGMEIRIRYEATRQVVQDESRGGPELDTRIGGVEVPVLQAKKAHPAFLRRRPNEAAYEPVAGPYSFARLEHPPCEELRPRSDR